MNQYHTDRPIFEDELCTAYEEMAYDLDISPASAAEPSTSVAGQPVAKNIHFDKPVYWQMGQTLKVAFYGGTDFQREEVMKHSQEWCKWANLNFDFVASHPCDIYIAFKPGSSWSLRGTQSLNRSRASPPTPSMNLGWIDEGEHVTRRRRTILHEFGHALGLVHEHQNAQRKWDWDVQAIYDHFAKPPVKWPPAKVDRNILGVCTGSLLRRNEVDQSSIMMYPSLGRFIRPGLCGETIDIPSNSELSNLDKAAMLEAYSEDAMKTDEMEFALVDSILKYDLNQVDEIREYTDQVYRSSRSC